MATLNAVVRDDSKKSIAKTLRKEGKIPSVVYGQTVGNESITVNAGEVDKLFHNEGRNAIITLNIDNKKKYTVMAHELQFNNLKGTIQHIDFLEINVNEELDAVVPVVLQGTEKVEELRAVVNHQLSELTVRALPKDLPSSIEIDVSELAVGESIRISDIKTENGYTILGDPEEVIVSVSYGGKNEEAEETEEPPAAEGAQTPEQPGE
ncbi:50S ribosomal protein L25 [Sporolactobacillus sp. KGMB 08714]|uniref:50S ribosomal protein L25 n=1 Tax=Sporolactobacillus sp. KGMB 08714 TaxID=3064704 RepID=UPI002FBEE4E3